MIGILRSRGRTTPTYLAVDGVMGPRTVAAINQIEERRPGGLLDAFKGLLVEHYNAVYAHLASEGLATEGELEEWLARVEQ
jgi:lysozyme family protein